MRLLSKGVFANRAFTSLYIRFFCQALELKMDFLFSCYELLFISKGYHGALIIERVFCGFGGLSSIQALLRLRINATVFSNVSFEKRVQSKLRVRYRFRTEYPWQLV
jgi:hypothetical protein